MKRILPVLLALFVLLTLPAYAASGKLTATAAGSGDNVTITVHLDNPGIVATRIFVRYDSAVLQLTGVQNGDVFPKANAEFGKDLNNNPYTVLWLDALRRDNNTTSGTLFTVTFDVKGGTESGKTSVRFAVDQASTFDVDYKDIPVAECSCSVDVPVVTTKASETTATTKPAVTEKTTAAAKPPATAKTTSAATTTTKTEKPDTATTKPSAAKPTTTQPVITAASGQTTTRKLPDKIESAVSVAASSVAESLKAEASSAAANMPSTAKDGSASAQPDETKSAASADGTAAENATDETIPDLLSADGTLSTAPETQIESQNNPETAANHRGLLWLLLLIPAAAAVFILVRKKKQ